MPALWSVLGYDEIASRIGRALSETAYIAVIEGPPGVGKSWLARDIGALWEAGGGSTVLAEGDSLRSDVTYYPFGFAMGGLPTAWRAVGPAVAGIARAGETLIGTAGLVTSAVQALARAHSAHRHGRTLLLSDAELDILHELERLARKRPVLLIADNLHWWDSGSLELLGRLVDPRMAASFPFLTELRLLAVQTPEPYQTVANPTTHDALLVPNRTRRFNLTRISREKFGDVLLALGATSAPPEVADVIYALSGGHLALASRCAARIAAGETSTFLSAADPEDFLRALLTERVHSLGTQGRQALALLQVAAVVGLTFSREEVTCASTVDVGETARLLRYCRDENVLELADGVGRFVHDLYRQYFLSAGAVDSVTIHENLSSCLRHLRPAEYVLRCINAIGAEQPREAGVLAVLAALQTAREGRPRSGLPSAVFEAIERAGLTKVIDELTAALHHLRDYRFADCLESLERLPRDLAKPLHAESDHLRAMCLMSTRSEDDRATGRAILEAWAGYEDEEPELGVRLMQLLLYGFSHVLDKETGLALEGRIRQALIERVSFDDAAKDALYTLDRCAGRLYQVDVSLVRNREAAAYFGPGHNESVIRRPVEYYRSLVNLGASLISNARYDEAVKVHRDLEHLITSYSADAFPRLDFPHMNAVLAEYRSGVLDSGEAVGRQREICTYSTAQNDPFYPRSALATYLALANVLHEALAIFTLLDGELARSRTQPEPSMTYLIRSNRTAARYVLGEKESARAEWDSLADVVCKIAYPSRPFYTRRHEILAEVMREDVALSSLELDEAPCALYPSEFGPLWTDYGRAFMLPAIELWREN